MILFLKRFLKCMAAVPLLLCAFTVSGCLDEMNSHRETVLREHAEKALTYAKKHGMNTNYVILVDYSIPSGSPRLFVWDFTAGKVGFKTHVMHGSGEGSTAEKPVFSNKIGSFCSSLGKFKVLKNRHGAKIKRSFMMEGLDSTNSNALVRGIMIHRSKWIDIWKWKRYIPLHEPSCQGCITVGSEGMNYLEKLIKAESKPLLLWSYCS